MSTDTKSQLAAVKREIRDFEKLLKSHGGSYRGPDGNYSPDLYTKHQRLYERKQDLERARKAETKMARQGRASDGGDRVLRDLESWGVDRALVSEVREKFKSNPREAMALARDLGWNRASRRGRAFPR